LTKKIKIPKKSVDLDLDLIFTRKLDYFYQTDCSEKHVVFALKILRKITDEFFAAISGHFSVE